MERRDLVVLLIVGFLGLLSAVLGLAAEGKRIKTSQVYQDSKTGVCIYPRSPAFGLGFASAIVLLIAHVLINTITGCICCRRSSPSSNSPHYHWALPLVCFVVSWFTFVLAFLFLLAGAILNDQHVTDNMYFDYYYCYVVKPGVFAGASILAVMSIVFGIISYLTIAPGKNAASSSSSIGRAGLHENGIAMGQGQVPPVSHDPVFVHEDTYIRRQFT